MIKHGLIGLLKIASILLISLVLVIRCSTEKQPHDEESSEKSEKSIERVVSLGGAMTEILYGLGAGDNIVGTDFSSLYPKEAQQTPKVGIWRSVTPESVLGLNPDLVAAMPDTGPDATLEKIKESGVNLYKPSADYSVEWTLKTIAELGEILFKEEEASVLKSKIESDLATFKTMQESKENIAEVTTLFIYMKGGKALIVGGNGTTAHSMIKQSGLRNLASNQKEWANVGPEYYLAQRPDFLIVSEQGLASIGGIESLKKSPGIGQMKALQENRVYVVDELAFLGYGPRVVEEQIKLYTYADSLSQILNH